MKITDLTFRASAKYKKFENSPVAFFCSEYALDNDLSMYAGGLGVLAGDYLLAAADQGLPVLALGLKYGAHDEESKQFCEHYQLLEAETGPLVVDVPIGQEIIKARVWVRRFGSSVILMLLDTDVPENPTDKQQAITRYLYDSDFYVRLKQQIVLSLGGVRLLQRLDFQPSVYHLNEGHTALAVLGLLAEKPADLSKVVATKHTIFSAAGLLISSDDFTELFGPYCQQHGLEIQAVFARGLFERAPNTFSTTRFLMTSTDRQNGVSVLHTIFEKKVHPDSRLIPITNGVSSARWQAPSLRILVSDSTPADLWQAKNNLRKDLVDFVAQTLGAKLDPQVCTLVWARRFASYKRPLLLFSDLQKLEKIIQNKSQPLQIIISGKAHEADDQGQEIIKQIKDFTSRSTFASQVVYLPDYSLASARFLTRGADIWLNTPERGKEACGTSGMKAGLNGALQYSVADGWVGEADWSDKGWILSDDNIEREIYEILSDEILPLFYDRSEDNLPLAWLKRMRLTIGLVQDRYLAGRMLDDYVEKLYRFF